MIVIWLKPMDNIEIFILVTLIYTGLFFLLGVDNTIRLTQIGVFAILFLDIYRNKK